MSILKLYGSAVGMISAARYLKGMLGAIVFGFILAGLLHILSSENVLKNFDVRDFAISYTILMCISFGLMQAKRLRAIGWDVRYIFVGVAFLILAMLISRLFVFLYIAFALSLGFVKGQELDKQESDKEIVEDRRTRRAKFREKYKK